MRPPFSPSIARIGVRPDEPAAVVGPRPRGSRRPHTDATVAKVGRLIEQTALTYGEIAARTSVGPRTAMRELRAGGVRIERAPEEALEDFIESRAPPPERQRPRHRGHRSNRNRAHAWLLEP